MRTAKTAAAEVAIATVKISRNSATIKLIAQVGVIGDLRAGTANGARSADAIVARAVNGVQIAVMIVDFGDA